MVITLALTDQRYFQENFIIWMPNHLSKISTAFQPCYNDQSLSWFPVWTGHIQTVVLPTENMIAVIETLTVMVLNKVTLLCFVTDLPILAELMP